MRSYWSEHDFFWIHYEANQQRPGNCRKKKKTKEWEYSSTPPTIIIDSSLPTPTINVTTKPTLNQSLSTSAIMMLPLICHSKLILLKFSLILSQLSAGEQLWVVPSLREFFPSSSISSSMNVNYFHMSSYFQTQLLTFATNFCIYLCLRPLLLL